MIIVGKTEDGKTVVSDVFKFVDTYGLPLDYLLLYLDDQNMVMDWLDFMLAAYKQGWSIKTIHARCIGGVQDAFGKSEFAKETIKRIDLALGPFL